MIQHPEHKANEADWKKYRLTYKGGKAFVEEYLEQRPNETNIKFQKRLKMTHCPAHSKSNLNEIKNSIFTRMHQSLTRKWYVLQKMDS